MAKKKQPKKQGVCKRCGADIRNTNRLVFCSDRCSQIWFRDNHKKERNKYKKKNYMDFKNGKSWVACKCPKCEKIHKVKMKWIGNGMPRKFCKKCITHLGQIYSGAIAA